MNDLLGLHTARRLVSKILETDAPAHALLFYGAEGAGKETLALELARGWLGLDSVDALRRGTHPDFLRIEPQPPSYLIRQDAIEPMSGSDLVPVKTFLRTPPLSSPRKVVLILEADRMNAFAAHSLLKTLEEPEPYARFILTTRSVGSVLPTILSRCLAVACALPESEEIATLTADLSDDLRAYALGSPGLARRIAENPEPYERLTYFVRKLLSATPPDLFRLTQEFAEICEELQGDTPARQAQAETLKLLASATFHRAPDKTPLLVEAHRMILGNAQAGLVFETLFARWINP